MSWLNRWFRTGRFHSGQRVLMHNGPGTPLELAVLIERLRGPDDHGIEVWTAEYLSEPGIIQKRALPCQCEGCK